MFGVASKNEQRMGVMNQFVVSKLTTKKRIYWTFHKRGENPVSVLIASLTVFIEQGKLDNETMIVLVSEASQNVTTLDATAYDRVHDTEIKVWGNTIEGTIANLVSVANDSQVLGYEDIKEQHDNAD